MEYLSRLEHEEFAKRMQDEHDRQNKRITLLEENIQITQGLTISVEKMAINMECMLKEQRKQGERLEVLEEVPKKNFDSFKFAMIGAMGTAFGTAIIGMLIKFL